MAVGGYSIGHMTKTTAREGRTSDADGSGTRERLIEAAAELIAEDGWGGVRMRAVAEREGTVGARPLPLPLDG
jgi:hypothetical protein